MSKKYFPKINKIRGGGGPALKALCLPAVMPPAVFLLSMMIVSAGSAHAAVGAPPGPMDLVWQGVNLAILLAVIVYFSRKPIAAFFRGAAGRQKEDYGAAQREAGEITAELEAQKRKITDLQRELERMVEAAKADAEEERRQLTATAEAQAERMRTQARNQVEQELGKATSELRAQLADEAVKLAGELIRSRMDDERQKQLISSYIQQLEAQR